MNTAYSFLLLPPHAAGAAPEPLDPMLLGVEATDPLWAAACGLGNIDPQHGQGAAADLAAIDLALTAPPPPAGARLATLRADPDSLGAMAVLRLRAEGRRIDEPILARIRRVSRADRFDHGPWPGRLPPPRAPEDWLRFAEGEEGLAPIAAAVFDHAVDLPVRVGWMRAWLLDGAAPAAYRDAVARRARALQAAFDSGDLTLAPARDGRVALLRGGAPGVLRLGYRLAPVALALQADAGPRKVTIAQYDSSHADFTWLTRRLRALEPGWGGGPAIIGSPQAEGSRLDQETLLDLTIEAMDRRQGG